MIGGALAKLEAIRAFVTVAKHGNLRDAANELGRTQSALSMALGQLEQTLGGPLFETDRKRDLTDLGQYVYNTGRALVGEHDRVMALIYGYANGEAGHLRIASVPSVAALILPGVLGAFMESHSGASVDLRDSDSANVRRMVAAGRADIGVAGHAATGEALVVEPLFEDRLFVVCKKDSALAQVVQALSWSDLQDAAFIRNEALSHINTPAADAVIAASKLSVRNVLSLFAMVAAGNGVTVLPGLATRNLETGLVAVPMKGAGSRRTISLLSREGPTGSPLAQAFHRHVIASMPTITAKYALAPAQGA